MLAVALTLASGQAAYGAGKPTSTNSKKPAKSVASEWLTPKKGDVPFTVKAGATIPLKFRIASGSGVEVKSAAGVAVTAVAETCPAPATAPATPAPVPTGTLGVQKVGKSNKNGALRYAGNSFIYQWKTLKTAQPGCYKFTATSGSLEVVGPVVRIEPAD